MHFISIAQNDFINEEGGLLNTDISEKRSRRLWGLLDPQQWQKGHANSQQLIELNKVANVTSWGKHGQCIGLEERELIGRSEEPITGGECDGVIHCSQVWSPVKRASGEGLNGNNDSRDCISAWQGYGPVTVSSTVPVTSLRFCLLHMGPADISIINTLAGWLGRLSTGALNSPVRSGHSDINNCPKACAPIIIGLLLSEAPGETIYQVNVSWNDHENSIGFTRGLRLNLS